MQDPSGDKVCRAGGEEEGEDGQHTSSVRDTEASSHQSEASSHRSETENNRGNSPHVNRVQDFGSQAAPGSLNTRNPVEARVVLQEAAIAPQPEQAPIIPGPSGDAATTAGSRLLEFRWTTEDPVLFRTSINAFLDQLSLVMRTIPRPVFMAVVKQGRGRNNEL